MSSYCLVLNACKLITLVSTCNLNVVLDNVQFFYLQYLNEFHTATLHLNDTLPRAPVTW